MASDYTIACYYFPNFHLDARNQVFHGKGWTEWELVKKAIPRFKNHLQPKVPLWDYKDEAQPDVMAQKIEAAAAHAVDVFIFDWYWYNDGPFLQRGLEEGFLNASNNDKMQFSIMWANHDWLDIHPAKYKQEPKLLYPGRITPATFEVMTDHILKHYFTHPSYWKIDNCPYFSIYELFRFIESFGSVDHAQKALARFREKTKAMGFKDLHLNAVNWGIQILPNEKRLTNLDQIISELNINSTTSYVWVHHIALDRFPCTTYEIVAKQALEYSKKAIKQFDVPYHPNVTMGWDPSPRTLQDVPYENIGYPYMAAITDNTPELFEKALSDLKKLMDNEPNQDKIITINAWNEWTEGSYLEPDTVNGMKYLEAIKKVFGQ
jgi:hypothetical protein